jgi:hypothetical protein
LFVSLSFERGYADSGINYARKHLKDCPTGVSVINLFFFAANTAAKQASVFVIVML